MEKVSKKELEKCKEELGESIRLLSIQHLFNVARDEDEYFKDICVSAALFESFLNNLVTAYDMDLVDREVEKDAITTVSTVRSFCKDIHAYLNIA